MNSREPTSQDNFRVVAQILVEEVEADDDDEYDRIWLACEGSRYRSSVSRAYYAVFLALKYRLSRLHPGWPRSFPTGEVHAKLLSAIESGIGADHQLTANFKQLRRLRGDADYAWERGAAWKDVNTALRVSGESLLLIYGLDRPELLNIRDALLEVHQNWNRG